MSDTSKAVLLITDISGFTQFMRQKTISINHAKQIVVRLLKAIMGVSRPPIKVAELEGDAVFFYARCDERDFHATMKSVKQQMRQFFEAFQRELRSIDNVRTCACDACLQVPDLKLKQVAHLGEVVFEKIDRFEKLFGIDVILVHRMLKNTVQKKEYVMMTEAVYEAFDGFFGIIPEQRKESFEGVGEVKTLVFYTDGLIEEFKAVPETRSDSGFLRMLSWRWEISYKFLLDFLKLKRMKRIFRNLPA